MNRVVVVGSANTDMIVQADRLPTPGETVLGGRFATAQGGKGANQAVAAARLGAHVTFVARLGQDALGEQAFAAYQTDGLDCTYMSRDPDQPSGVALILVDRHGENMIAVASGANAALSPTHVETARAAVQSADSLLTQLESPLATVAAALDLARSAGVRAILNPAPARSLPDTFLQGVILTPNETEVAQLTGLPVHNVEQAEAAARQLLDRGAAAVVVTLGRQGALLVTPSDVQLVPAFAVQAVDTTAAGDAFNGGLAVALSRGLALPEAVRDGNAVAALSVTRLGAQPSLPTQAEVVRFLEER
ncbi:MAG: ribokinase [Anaerolineae bacterium]|nr:ribokinase [Anaerolineae bacterium]